MMLLQISYISLNFLIVFIFEVKLTEPKPLVPNRFTIVNVLGLTIRYIVLLLDVKFKSCEKVKDPIL